MTHLLWKYYWDDDVDKFRRLLAPAAPNTQNAPRSPHVASGGIGGGAGAGSPALGTSPRPTPKSRKQIGFGGGSGARGNGGLGKEVNSRDHVGLTVLLRAASSTSENAVSFVEALLEHPAIDIYVQDPESGWNALHRALYAGNISIARMLLEKERRDLTAHTASLNRVGQLIKTKDNEGNSPFDLYNATIGERSLKDLDQIEEPDDGSDSDDAEQISTRGASVKVPKAFGEDLYAFGSNRNLSLGFGDDVDRQYPEKVYLKRPDHLLQRFYNEYLEGIGAEKPASQDLTMVPSLVLNKPLLIKDVVLSKLHSAILTADPVSNLYLCGVGRGGRLGLGDENTRFTWTPVQGPFTDRKVVQVALGQNHTMAIDDTGSLWTWGSNAHSQLGYVLPTPAKSDEEPISTVPRQVFGPLKKEYILGVAASSIHSVAHTGASLYCWGKNVGQLALMDADSRSLEVQHIPRKVAASLFSSPIVMVSAIDKATTVLLQNHTVFVFTGYGYHIVKFPFGNFDMVGNINLSTRNEPGWNQINYITSGGETIAALTKRGDLFTMNLDHKIELNPSNTSTTNPSKLKAAVTQPICIWNARKDGARSVGVGENGSVILSTKSGAVWRRIKRAKAKNALSSLAESRRSDFKFQRVPYITKVATVRASTFGAFAAIRQDSDVMKEQLVVGGQSLWQDVAPLNCLDGFEASLPSDPSEDANSLWKSDSLRDRLGLLAYELLKSPDLDKDLTQHLTTWSSRNAPLDVHVCVSSSPEIRIPIHGWLLAARSSVLRNALAQYRKDGSYTHELFTISDEDGKQLVCFQGVDLLSLVNLVVFAYTDKVVPAWNLTRQAPSLAYRYRQIRLEVMKLGTRLNMANLEAAARLQVDAKKCMDEDFQHAIKDRRKFFEDGDAILELDGADVTIHSTFFCQRSPWFQCLYHGRSRGMWLASRRVKAGSGKIKIDCKHMEPEAFQYVLQFLYGDCGPELFDPAVCESLEDFFDLVMEVMSIANYLMLDRLSQICQQVMGRFVNIRNVSDFLNAISPCYITEFKDAGLEYICLQLETMLENHLLDELDQDLLFELDEVVRDNQAAQSPFVKSGQADLILHENNPRLVEDIDEERQIRVKEMAYKVRREEERKLSVPVRTKYGSLDDLIPVTPTPDRVKRVTHGARNAEAFVPDLRSKDSRGDLMFEMDEEDPSPVDSPSMRPRKASRGVPDIDQIPPLGSSFKGKGKKVWMSFEQPEQSFPHSPLTPVTLAVKSPDVETTPGKAGGSPWGTAPIPTAKLDLRHIIQSETTGQSALSAGLAAAASQKAKDESSPAAAAKTTQQKMSQKEKKRQQQAAQAAQVALLASKSEMASKNAWERSASEEQASPWKVASNKKQPSVTSDKCKNLLSPDSPSPSPSVPINRRTASPDTRFSGQHTSSAAGPSSSTSVGPTPPAMSKPAEPKPEQQPLVPHSKNYITPAHKAESFVGYSMEDIIAQERRNQEAVKEAAAKRSLQEIQQEQAFQEWWDAESRRMQEEEARRVERAQALSVEGMKRGGGRGKGRGGGGGGAEGSGSGRRSKGQQLQGGQSQQQRPQQQGEAAGNSGKRGDAGGRGGRGGKASRGRSGGGRRDNSNKSGGSNTAVVPAAGGGQ
ncbi:BTB/POZ domain-containing protein 1 [Podospora fimiseda]|uniref:BTB/POZ domain-containing protein 1 n=1 Tax=Podospora fimiseda TaxID=252190 RepID=A0AAN7BWB8_9PEZI|nr:BTB/POZ domain-containing protein 1 [Podospora fimiseda]